MHAQWARSMTGKPTEKDPIDAPDSFHPIPSSSRKETPDRKRTQTCATNDYNVLLEQLCKRKLHEFQVFKKLEFMVLNKNSSSLRSRMKIMLSQLRWLAVCFPYMAIKGMTLTSTKVKESRICMQSYFIMHHALLFISFLSSPKWQINTNLLLLNLT